MSESETTTSMKTSRPARSKESLRDIDLEAHSSDDDDDEDVIDTALAAEAISEALYTSSGRSVADVLDYHLNKMCKVLIQIEKNERNKRY